MTRSKKIAAGCALIGAAALGLVAASPAAAHTNDIYSHLGFFDDEGGSAFVTLDRVTADAAPLPTTFPPTEGDFRGIEVFEEQGYAIIPISGGVAIAPWDHTSGALGEGVPLAMNGLVQVDDVSGLDIRPDGSILTTVDYRAIEFIEGVPTEVRRYAVATIDAETGELTPVVDFTDLNPVDESVYRAVSIATDPLSGVSFVFLDGWEDGKSYFLPVDIGAGTHGELGVFGGEGFGAGIFQGADFDADGTLYFIYGNGEREVYELSTLGAPVTWLTADRVYIADAASNYEGYPLSTLALSLEVSPVVPIPSPEPAPPTPPAPELAATGGELPSAGIIAAGGALLAGALLLARRPRRA